MTVRKHFKQLVRERMQKTGESYTSARRQLMSSSPLKQRDLRTRWHLAGNIPAATALRVVLAAAGVRNPQTKEPFSEAMCFGIAGGVGAGVCSFHYAKENFSSFFIAGRHSWHDDVSYLKEALARFGIKPTIRESSGAKTADKQLREALADGPCIAWVDMANLPHRAMPAAFSGGGYHVVTLYRIDDDTHTAEMGDLTDEPVTIALNDLATARARIKKQKNRLLNIAETEFKGDLRSLVVEGLRACHTGLGSIAKKGYASMFSLGSFRRWEERLYGSKDKDSWEAIFAPGAHLWTGLTSLHMFAERYGTGGGLCRPIMADFLTEAGFALKDAHLRQLGERYRELGVQWSSLANAALPDDVPMFREAKHLYDEYAEQLTTGAGVEEKQKTWARLDELAAEAKKTFPLNAKQAGELRAQLQERVRKLCDGEEAAQAAIGDYLR